MDRIRRRVLVVLGDPTSSPQGLVDALQSRALDVVVVARHREALDAVARGEAPDAVLLLDCRGRPDCLAGCKSRHRIVPDCIIDCIREHPGLEEVPVVQYSLDARPDPTPEELASLLAAAAACHDRAPVAVRPP